MTEFLEVTSFDPLIVTALPGPAGPTGPAGAAGPTGPTGPTSGGTVTSVTAGDATVTVGGTATDPTVKVTPGTFDVSGAAATAQSVSLQKSSNLSDVASASTSRTNLGLGTAATQNKVAAGSAGVLDATDATTTNARTPTAHTHVEADVTSLVADLAAKVPTTRTVSAGTGLTGGGDLSANRTVTLADTAVTPGTYAYASVTVDQQGRLTSASSGGAGYDQFPAVGLGSNSYEPFPRWFASGSSGAIESTGRIVMGTISLPAGFPVGHLSFHRGNTGLTTPTHWWFGLWDSSLAQLAVTADQTTTAWIANSLKTLPIATVAAGAATSFTTTYAGLYYVGCLAAASGGVGTLAAIAGQGASALLQAAPQTNGYGASTGLTSPPAFPSSQSPFSSPGNVGQPWFAVSP